MVSKGLIGALLMLEMCRGGLRRGRKGTGEMTRAAVRGFWGTLGWALALLGVMALVGFALVYGCAAFYGIDPQQVPGAVNPALLSSLASIMALAPLCLVIALAIRRVNRGFAEYLALRRPSRRHLAIGLCAITALMVVVDVLARAMHWPVTSPILVEGIARDRSAAMLALMALSLTVTTPIGEELVFRGFIYRGFAASRLGVAGAVALSSLLFAVLHVQYDLIGLGEVLASGLVLGTMRAVSGSTLLTIAMHALVNAVSLIEAVMAAGVSR